MADAIPMGNPTVAGLAGFGTTTLLLQFPNLGWCGTGVVFADKKSTLNILNMCISE